MLNPTLFDAVRGTLRNRVSCVVCSVYYTRYANHEKVYTLLQKTKNSLEVPSNLIFTKTVSSLFVFKNINNYLRKKEVDFAVLRPLLSFFSGSGRNTLHTTHYTLHTIYHNGVNREV